MPADTPRQDFAPPQLSESYPVRSYHLDAESNLSPVALVTMLLDAAGMHAHELGVSVTSLMNRDNLTWMLSRFSVTLDREPHWNDMLKITTWPVGVDRLAALRDFEFAGSDGVVLGTARSSWLVIDLEKRRPVRADMLLKRFAPDMAFRAGFGAPPKLSPQTSYDHEQQFTVRWSDIDFNRHVTSTSYISWALESIPPDIRKGRVFAGLDINYRAETFYGETITAQWRHDKSAQRFDHRIMHTGDVRELAIARTMWR